MAIAVVIEAEVNADLIRLFACLLDRAEYLEDLDIADRALEAIDAALGALSLTPFMFRKEVNRRSELRRELVVPRAASGYVVKYAIPSPELGLVLAVRHRRAGDCR